MKKFKIILFFLLCFFLFNDPIYANQSLNFSDNIEEISYEEILEILKNDQNDYINETYLNFYDEELSYEQMLPLIKNYLFWGTDKHTEISQLKERLISLSYFVSFDPDNHNVLQWKKYAYKLAGLTLADIASRKSVKALIEWTASDYINEEDLPYMQQWFSTALEKNPYETIIALRRALYKEKIEFWNPIAKDFLLDFYHKALKKY